MPRQLVVADLVIFTHNQEAVQGTLTKKGRTHAYVITADHREFRVPYHQLEKVGGTVDQPVLSPTDRQRAVWQAGDTVQFGFRGSLLHGVLVRLNPTRAHVVGEDGTEYRVPYARLAHVAGTASQAYTARSAAHLDAIVQLAITLMAAHGICQLSRQNSRLPQGVVLRMSILPQQVVAENIFGASPDRTL